MKPENESLKARLPRPYNENYRFDLSIIIVNYKAKRFLGYCLNSVYNSKINLNFEIWLIDNSSRDDSVPWVKQNFPQVNLIENEWNLGFSKAANQGIRESQGRYMLLLNPDTKISQGKIGGLLKFMDENPEAGICGPKMVDEKGELLYSCRSFPDFLTSISSSQSVLNRLFPHNPLSRKYLLKDLDRTGIKEVDWVSGSCLFARRKMLEQVGLLDEDFFMFCEDTDLCLRAKENGWKVFYFPFLTVAHQVGGSVFSNPLRARLEHHRSMYYFFKKHYHPNFIFRLVVYLSLVMRLVLLSLAYGFAGSFKKK
jgi:GT2 family glycosyltransferase